MPSCQIVNTYMATIPTLTELLANAAEKSNVTVFIVVASHLTFIDSYGESAFLTETTMSLVFKECVII